MEIQDIKQKLTLAQVLKYYNLKPDKNLRLHCPFHEDKTPSFQVYYKTHTGYCFSSNCKTHGKSLDVIDFIMHKENCSKHEAIQKAEALIGNGTSSNLQTTAPSTPTINTLAHSRISTLGNLFIYFKNAVHNSKPAQDYIKRRGLDPTKLEIGYNTGQFHHGARRDETLIQNCVTIGILSPWGTNSRKPSEQSYRPFAKNCISFALRNRANQVTGMYFRSTINNEDQKHYYLKESTGLYPKYPEPDTEKLIIAESIIDTASLLQIESIAKEYTLLASYGTNRLNDEIKQAIGELKNLKEIIFAFDNDEAGRRATAKYSDELISTLPHLLISTLNQPCKDVNETLVAHQPEVFLHLLETRTCLSFSTEIQLKEKNSEQEPTTATISKLTNQPISTLQNQLDTRNPHKLSYHTDTAQYYIQGGISKQLDSMKVTIVVEQPETQTKSRNKVDLYEDKQVERLCKEVSEKLNLRKEKLEADIYKLTDQLDNYRESQLKNETGEPKTEKIESYPLTTQERTQVESFLKQPQLIKNLNELLGKAGITGEEKNRIFLLVIAISYKMPETLHALIQGSSGSGKTRLLKQISDCIPPEKVTKLTRLSDKVLYNYPERYFMNRLLCLEDIDGLSEEAEFAFRELQSNGELNSAVSIKLENGNITQGEKKVRGPIASMACTTRGEIYEDNMSRVFLLAVDESTEQTKRIIIYQNRRAAGDINEKDERETKQLIQKIVREIKPMEVINPFASQIHLPEEAHKIRRLNELFQSFIKMITIINQYQRKKTPQGKLLTEIEDIETAVEIMFESIVLKVDELDGSLRQFLEKLKPYIDKKGRNHQFTRFEVREATGLGKTQQHHYLSRLVELEYLQQNGFPNRGYTYKIVYWDNYTALRNKIKNHLQEQLDKLKTEHQTNANRTPELQVRNSQLIKN